VNGLRGVLLGTPAHLGLDFLVLIAAVLAGITAASALVARLAR
jgi:ABC-2 type transport system permease protein